MTSVILELNDASCLIRHCPKKSFDNGVASYKVYLFTCNELREANPFLSFIWLEKLCADAGISTDHASAITELEQDNGFPREIKMGEKWIFINCARIRAALNRVPDCTPVIFPKPTSYFQSHVGVSGYDRSQHKQAATELWQEVQQQNIHDVTRARKYRPE